MSSLEIISDYSKANLSEIPETVLSMVSLKMLFLERNSLVTLPDNFFYRLPNLMWLDLRNNLLEGLPRSIAHHEHLEHLLLTNNNIAALPNELGLVANLKALQVADNPLVYPPKKIVQEGTKAIKKFLKERYEIECAKKVEEQREAVAVHEQLKRELQEKEKMVTELQEEMLIKVHEEAAEIGSLGRSSKVSGDYLNSTHRLANVKNKKIANTNLIESLQSKLTDPQGLVPTLKVKKIEYPTKKPEEPLKIVHSVSKSDTKISLKSFFQKPGLKSNLERIPENALKEGWLNKLRMLLNDQERILQQERNLRALAGWRQKKPTTPPKTFYDSDAVSRTSDAPYATYPEYCKIPSRTELAAQLKNFLKETDVNRHRRQTPQINLDRIINDLMEQLKEMEIHYDGGKSPRTEIDNAGRQIQTIVDIHKKLLQLKAANDCLPF